ncbi:MAG TPA: flagellar export protein FliJ [Phycisphaerales bacterium]|nr:flagellar export protein FliJ [Phycisphaerales bacterium]
MAQKKFVYRLQKILEFKEKKEEEEKEKLAKLMDQLEHEKRVKAQLEQKLVEVQQVLRQKQAAGTLNVEELRFYPGHIKNIKNQIRNQELRLQELAIRIKEQRNALMKAAQERQVYQKHKEKCQEEWQAEMDRAEAIMLDELATINFARNQTNDD